MPAANQVPATLRIKSTGLAHAAGAGVSTSSMTKSPFCWSGTPVTVVLCRVNGAAASQINVANTLFPYTTLFRSSFDTRAALALATAAWYCASA